MTLEDAIKNREDCLKYLEGLGQKASPQNVEAVRWSVRALKFMQSLTLTPPDEPLTLEQLREMDGEPAWVKVIGKTGIRCDGWCEVEIREKDPFAYVWWPRSEVEDIAKIEDYGKTWACYAYPPAHIDREALCGTWEGEADGYADGELVYDVWRCGDCGYVEETDDPDLLPRFCPSCGRAMTPDAWTELEKRLA